MKTSLKLIELVRDKGEDIAGNWARDVRKNAKTPFYHDLPDEKILPQAIHFYEHLLKIVNLDDPFAGARDYFSGYAERLYRDGVPLNEAVYALVLMRRHIWLYAEFQVTFITAIERNQAVESLLRTTLIFDYIMYFVTETYETLLKRQAAPKRTTRKKGDYVIPWSSWASLWGEGRDKKEEAFHNLNDPAR
jgi:hypothetical protein